MKTTTLLSVCGLLAASCALGEQLDTSTFAYSCEVTFSGYKGTSTLENFPALVRIPSGSLIYRGSVDGKDLRFADAAGNLVPHEVDSWHRGGESLVWVRVPALSGTTTKLTMYAGGTSTQAVTPSDVWSAAGYCGVWHFEGSCADSSANALTCIAKRKSPGALPTFTTAGSVGSCFSSAGYGYVVVSNDTRWAAFPNNVCTVSCWVRYDGPTNQSPRIVSCKKAYADDTGFELHWKKDKSATDKFGVNTISSGNSQKTVWADCQGEPDYLTVTFANGRTTAYVNGTNALDVSSALLAATTCNLCIGAQGNESSYWNGTLDEVRLQGVAPSADWAAADYATQATPDFAVLGPVVFDGTLVDPDDFLLKATVTFSGYSGEEPLYNFPALVRIPAASGLAAASFAGSGLRFADADGYLVPHEIDTFRADGETLVWVRVPCLSGRDTTLTVYSGAKAGAPAALPSGDVWSGVNYRGVWHFDGSAQDSSPNGLLATASTGITFTQEGPVGKCFYNESGTSKNISIANDASWVNYPSNALTVSGWIKTDVTSGSARIISCKPSGQHAAELGFEFTMQKTTNAVNAIGHGGNQHTVALADDLEFYSEDVYVTAVYKDGNSLIYANGVLQDERTGGGYLVYPTTEALTLGRGWVGRLDELRLQWAAQDAAWIKADYDTQHMTDFAVVGAVEDLGATTLDPASYRRRATVTFSGYAGASTLANFPALVRVPAGSPLYVGTAADGSDLRFVDGANRLVPHEVERWNKSGESLVWVSVPQLSGTATSLTVYTTPIRGMSVPAARSPREVWGLAGYRGVWHFAGSAADSSLANLTATASGVTYATFGPLGQAFQSSPDGTAVGGYVQVDDASFWNGFNGRALTVSAWIHNTMADEGYFDRIVSTKSADTDPEGFEVTRQKFVNKLNGNGNRTNTSIGQHATEITPFNMNTETLYTTFVFGDGIYDTFVNAQRCGEPLADAPTLLTPVKKLKIGGMAEVGSHRWHGQIDEVRLRWVESSADWRAADFATQDPSGSFAEIGPVDCYQPIGCVLIFR